MLPLIAYLLAPKGNASVTHLCQSQIVLKIELQIWIHNHHQSTVLDGERVVGAELDAGQCYTFHQAVPSFRFSPNSKTYDLHMAHYYETDCVR